MNLNSISVHVNVVNTFQTDIHFKLKSTFVIYMDGIIQLFNLQKSNVNDTNKMIFK